MASQRRFDVIIVGAGLTGLVAARSCQKRGKRVLVLEARDRVGGRTQTRQLIFDGKASYFDLGARFVGNYPQHHNLWELLRELKLKHFPQYQGPRVRARRPGDPYWAGIGANLLQFNGEAHPVAYIGAVMPTDASGQFYLKYLKSLIDDFPLHDPGRLDQAEALDALSVQDWVNAVDLPGYGKPNERFRELLQLLCRVGFSEEPQNISMLWFLFYIASSGGIERFQALRWPLDGAQGYRVETGAQSIADALRAELDAKTPDTVRVGLAVTRIAQNDRGVTVETEDEHFRADKVLVALSPSLYGDARRIRFEPDLPPGRRAAAEAMKTPHMIVATATFKTPFWRAPRTRRQGLVDGSADKDVARYGFSGDVLFASDPIVWMMDATSSVGQPALFAFIVGDSAKAFARESADRRKARVLERMRSAFGADADADAESVEYFEQDWSREEFTGGAPAAHFGKGSFLRHGKEILLAGNANPHGRVYFASTESAMIANGYMAGAVWSGSRVADEICQAEPREELKVTALAREQAMLWCIRQILRAIQEQNPLLEFPALDEDVVFYGPGGDTLPRGPYSKPEATFEFYRRLAEKVTLTNVEIQSCSVDVRNNSGFAAFSASGIVNGTGNPFHDVRAEMVFEFNDPKSDKVLIRRDWLFLDAPQIDALVAAPPGPFSQASSAKRLAELEQRGKAIAALDIANIGDDKFVVCVVGRTTNGAGVRATKSAGRSGVVKGRGVAAIERLAAQQPKRARKVLAQSLDREAMIYYSWQRVSSQNLLVTVRFTNTLAPEVAAVEFRFSPAPEPEPRPTRRAPRAAVVRADADDSAH